MQSSVAARSPLAGGGGDTTPQLLCLYADGGPMCVSLALGQPVQVVCVEDGLPTWLCEMMVTRGDIHDAIAYVKQIESEIQKTIVIT